MEADKISKQLARDYFGGLAHVHTRISNFPFHHESNLTISTLVKMLAAAGLCGAPGTPLRYILINEHASNPTLPRAPRRFGLRPLLLQRRRQLAAVGGVPILYGLEASILKGGAIDVNPSTAKERAIIIASRHHIARSNEKNPTEIMTMFEQACANPLIDVLGHPARNIEEVATVDWQQVFAWARESGTAIEVNLNTFPDPTKQADRYSFWQRWLAMLGTSGASVFIGTDLHNDIQVKQFIAAWQGVGKPKDRYPLATCLNDLVRYGIAPDKVVTSRYGRLEKWLRLDKAARSQISSW